MISLLLFTGLLASAETAPEPEPEVEVLSQYGGVVRSEDDSLREWLEAVYEAKRAVRAPQEQAAEAIQNAKQSVAMSEAPIDLSGVQAALQALESAIEKAEATAKIRQRRADLEKAANIAVQAAQELRQKREEEDVLFLFLLAS